MGKLRGASGTWSKNTPETLEGFQERLVEETRRKRREGRAQAEAARAYRQPAAIHDAKHRGRHGK